MTDLQCAFPREISQDLSHSVHYITQELSLRFEKYRQNLGSFRGFIEKFSLFSNRSEVQAKYIIIPPLTFNEVSFVLAFANPRSRFWSWALALGPRSAKSGEVKKGSYGQMYVMKLSGSGGSEESKVGILVNKKGRGRSDWEE